MVKSTRKIDEISNERSSAKSNKFSWNGFEGLTKNHIRPNMQRNIKIDWAGSQKIAPTIHIFGNGFGPRRIEYSCLTSSRKLSSQSENLQKIKHIINVNQPSSTIHNLINDAKNNTKDDAKSNKVS